MAAGTLTETGKWKCRKRSQSLRLIHPDMTLQPQTPSNSSDFLPSDVPELRVILLGNSWTQRSSVGNFLLRETKFNTQEEAHCCLRVKGHWETTDIVLINTPDLLHLRISQHKLSEYIKECIKLSAPGPHVFLLVLQPEDFHQEQKQRLYRVLQLFSDQAFAYSVSLISTPKEESLGFMEKFRDEPPLSDLIRKCRYRYLWQKNLKLPLLMKWLVQTSNEKHLRCEVMDEDEGLPSTAKSKSRPLNLVLCGGRGPEKTSAAESILGGSGLHPVSSSSECVLNQGEVCGRWLSLVELPALSGKPQQEVMEESFRCISLCGPEGVHAFILVLPVGPLTDEDKAELQTIQDTFSSRVNDFTVILFTVDSDPTATAVTDFITNSRDVQELLQSCGGRYVVLNIRDRKQVPELLEKVEKNNPQGFVCFTNDTFTKGQIEKVINLQADLHNKKHSSVTGGESVNPTLETLRIVLIGKSGSGKSATGNIILGGQHFKPRIAPKIPNKYCEKKKGEIGGRPVVVVNTPPLFDQRFSGDKFQQEIKRSMSMLDPGPHVFLLVLQIGNLSFEEKESLELIKKYFGRKSQDFTMILFTRGDDLESLTINEYLNECYDFVKKFIQDCRGRYHVLNNKNLIKNQTQVTELLQKIEAVVRDNNGSCYTTEMTTDMNEEMMERLLKEKEEEIRKNLRKT